MTLDRRITLRVPTDILDRAARLLPQLAGNRRRPKPSLALRLALERGVAALEQRHTQAPPKQLANIPGPSLWPDGVFPSGPLRPGETKESRQAAVAAYFEASARRAGR